MLTLIRVKFLEMLRLKKTANQLYLSLQPLFYSHFLICTYLTRIYTQIHDLHLDFCEVWKVQFVINILFIIIILKGLFDIGSCSTGIFNRTNTLK